MNDQQEEKLDRLLDLIKETVVEKKTDKEYREAHSEEHRYLRAMIKRQEANAEFKRSVAQKVISGGVWACIVSIFFASVFTIKSYLNGTIQ